MIRRATIALLALAASLLAAAPASAVGPGVITGTVSPVSVAPEVEVCVVEAQPSELCTAPDPSGSYRLTGVPVGPQRVEFVPSYRSGYLKQYFDHKSRLEEATTIQVNPPPAQEVKGVNAELELGSSIAGTVRAASGGGPLANVEVCLQGAGTGVAFGCSTTDLSGEYAVVGLPRGTYKVGFWGRGTSARYAPESTVISVPVASTVPGVDAELAVGGLIEGTVTAAATGAALPGIPVCLFAVGAERPGQCVFTGASGAYSILGLVAGEYEVGFSLEASELGGDSSLEGAVAYLPQYYDDAATRSGAQTLPMVLGEVRSGVDAALILPPQLAPSALPGPISSTPSSTVPVISEPAKAKKKKKCQHAGGKRASRGPSACDKKSHRRKRHRRHHRADHAPKRETKVNCSSTRATGCSNPYK